MTVYLILAHRQWEGDDRIDMTTSEANALAIAKQAADHDSYDFVYVEKWTLRDDGTSSIDNTYDKVFYRKAA